MRSLPTPNLRVKDSGSVYPTWMFEMLRYDASSRKRSEVLTLVLSPYWKRGIVVEGFSGVHDLRMSLLRLLPADEL